MKGKYQRIIQLDKYFQKERQVIEKKGQVKLAELQNFFDNLKLQFEFEIKDKDA